MVLRKHWKVLILQRVRYSSYWSGADESEYPITHQANLLQQLNLSEQRPRATWVFSACMPPLCEQVGSQHWPALSWATFQECRAPTSEVTSMPVSLLTKRKESVTQKPHGVHVQLTICIVSVFCYKEAKTIKAHKKSFNMIILELSLAYPQVIIKISLRNKVSM